MINNQPFFRMRKILDESVALPIWPDGICTSAFAENDASRAHTLLALAYRNGGGSVPPLEEWWQSLRRDSEYDSTLCFSVENREGRLIGFAQCWTSAFVKDLAVHPQFRRLGIGRALLLHIFREFQARGALTVDLKVAAKNPTGANALYESLGMRAV
jgi:ribosomal protein S18 acetylase RimI-like enzyme